MTLEQVGAQINECRGAPISAALSQVLQRNLDAVRPALPFDLEPSLDRPRHAVDGREDRLRAQYDRVRVWEALQRELHHLTGRAR